MQKISTKLLMALGFGTIILLMVLIVTIALNQLNLTFIRIHQVVNQNNIKTRLITNMLLSARERTISIQKISSLDDPFERDNEFMLFNSYGAEFAKSRTELKTLELNKDEIKLLEAQGKLTNNVIVPMQRQIVDLAMAGRQEEAQRILREKAIKGQNKVFKPLYRLLHYVEKSSSQAVHDVSLNLQESRTQLVIILTLIILGSLYISLYVIRRTTLAEKQLSREKEKAQVTLHSIGEGVITTDSQGLIEYMNTVAEKLTGYSKSRALGQSLHDIFPIKSELDDHPVINPLLDVISQQKMQNSDIHAILKSADQTEFAIEYTASPITDADNTIIGIVLVFRDVTSMRTMANQLGYQASHDELTGLINRREFENRLNLSLQSARIDLTEHTLCYLDLDQFKIVNDTCGHVAGDELLRQLSKLLKHEIRDGDTLARLGGDEFGVLYLNCSMLKAKELAEHLRRVINSFKFNWNDKSFTVGVSIGIVQINMYSNLNAILSAADTACYVAKDQGRNRIHCYKDNDDELLEREGQIEWVHRINHALDENRFKLYYQPIYSFSTNKCSHYEILVRLIDENDFIIPPMAFIPAAERYNLMNLIDCWIFRNTLGLISHFFKKKDTSNKPLFAINLSAQSLCDDNFLDFVKSQLELNDFDPDLICFEITETSAIVNLTRAQHFINTLKKVGVKFSLDDFGSGLSSFAYLKNLPVDFLKIDGAFVRDIINDPIDMAMVESINQVGHIMGIKTIAEYVETREIFDKLNSAGVDSAQGYYISRPMPLELIELQETIQLS